MNQSTPTIPAELDGMNLHMLRRLVTNIIHGAAELLQAAQQEPALADMHEATIRGFVDSLQQAMEQPEGSNTIVNPELARQIIRINAHLQRVGNAVARYKVVKQLTGVESLASAIHDTYYLEQDPDMEAAQILINRTRNVIIHIRTTQGGDMAMPLQLIDLCTSLAARDKFPELLEVLQRYIAPAVQAGMRYTQLMLELKQSEEPTPGV